MEIIPKRWISKASPSFSEVQSLSSAIRSDSIVSSLLLQRNIRDYDTAKKFFRPKLADLHDPFLMKDMKPAVNYLHDVLTTGKTILIYGDYDVDGTTAVALFYGVLEIYYPNLHYYLPCRYQEGYGLSEQAILWAKEHQVACIVTLDCGIKDNNTIALANELGIDVIVCDHHQPGVELPPARAILNPLQKTCAYPYKSLSGCGVSFKLLQALFLKQQRDPTILYQQLDLVALSIAADIVPITGENRILTYYGLKYFNNILREKTLRPGLQALCDNLSLKPPLETTHLIFSLAPRINAAGRIAHAKKAVSLFLSPNAKLASQEAETIELYNQQRREIDETITKEAYDMLLKESKERYTTILYKNTWHKGVIGIVASRCIEVCYKPTIMLTTSGDFIVGSARSTGNFNIYRALVACQEHLVRFGGHAFAAGLSLLPESLDAFKKKFETVVQNTIEPDQRIPLQPIDLKIDLQAINAKMLSILDQMGPFGPKNRKSVFVSAPIVAESFRLLKEKHLKIHLRMPKDAPPMEAIGFHMHHYLPYIQNKKPFAAAYTLTKNSYLGHEKIQLQLKDIKTMEDLPTLLAEAPSAYVSND